MIGDGSLTRRSARRIAYSDRFVAAALLAPPISLIILFLCLLVAALASGSPPGSVWGAMVPALFLLVLASLMGAVPSLVFGGIVLAAIKALGLSRSPLVLVLGGGLAAALYVVFGLGLAMVSPLAALLVAPWATLFATDRPETLGAFIGRGDVWVPVSILLSGMAAGLIYARSSQRG